MDFRLQRANGWKRISALVLDGILLSILAVGIGSLLSWIFGYDALNTRLEEAYTRYETEYNVSFAITQEDYEAFTEAEKENYDAAYAALIGDEEAMQVYRKITSTTMLMVTFSLLAAFLILDFAMPLLFGDGKTIGKWVFGLALVTPEGVKVRKVALFVRTILGKFTLETMIPVYVLLMLFFGLVGLSGTILLLGLLIVQLVMYFTSENRTVIHDRLAGTVVVDYASQKIFATREEMLEAKKQAAAEKAARQEW